MCLIGTAISSWYGSIEISSDIGWILQSKSPLRHNRRLPRMMSHTFAAKLLFQPHGFFSDSE